MANTVRYTQGSNYDPADSAAANASLAQDTTHDYQILRSENGDVIRFALIDRTTNSYVLLADQISREEIDGRADGLFADFSGNAGIVGLAGGMRGDTLIGGLNNDILNGYEGNDVLIGGLGADAFNGGIGSDTVSYASASSRIRVSAAYGGTDNFGDAAGDTFVSIERFIGSAFDDEFYPDTDVTVEGGAGADRIGSFTDSRIILSYEHSAEGVSVNLTTNKVSGGDATGDKIGYMAGVIGSANSDLLIGRTGFDTYLDGNGGLDTIIGSDGNDTITVSGTWASVFGGAGNDQLVIRTDGGSTVALDNSVSQIEQILVRGGGEADLSALAQSTGTIRIASAGGSVIGTQGGERIVGSVASDTIAGDGGTDRLSGGEGADTFVYRFATDLEGSKVERIVDFSGHAGEGDKVDLFALGIAQLHEGRFDADGSAQARVIAGENGYSTIKFDFDGDGNRDASLKIKSDAPLTADDFVLATSPTAPLHGELPNGAFAQPVEHAAQHLFVGAHHPYDYAVLV